MDTIPLHGDLQIDQDLQFSRREWRVQHIGWLAMVAVIVAAALGSFGGGPLSAARARTADGRLIIEHERIARHNASDMLRVDVGPEAVTDGTVRVWFDREYIQDMRIESISPEPEQSSAVGDRIVYEFHVTDSGRRTVITFHTKHGALGRQLVSAGLLGGDSLQLRQFILP